MSSTPELAGIGAGGEGDLASFGSTGSLQGAASMSSADEPLPIVRTCPCPATAVTSVCSVHIVGTSLKSQGLLHVPTRCHLRSAVEGEISCMGKPLLPLASGCETPM